MAVDLFLWSELMILQTLIGYCFVTANVCIGLYNIRDLGNLKGDVTTVKAHKWIGRIETLFFYGILVQCIILMMNLEQSGISALTFAALSNTAGFHTMIGGIVGTALFTPKFIIATFKKDIIYRYGRFIGPIGFVGWSLAHWTSLVNYYYLVIPYGGLTTFIPPTFIWSAILPVPIGLCIFLAVLLWRGGIQKEKRFSIHQIAFILHGITFGYEQAAKDLLGSPALFQYVVPRTTQFLEKMFQMVGIDLKKIEKMNINDGMALFAKQAAEIRMAENVKIKWETDEQFSIEAVNCSTAQVRSVMTPNELENAICPWAIMAASIASKITGKEIEIDPSDFNEIGAKTRLRILAK